MPWWETEVTDSIDEEATPWSPPAQLPAEQARPRTEPLRQTPLPATPPAPAEDSEDDELMLNGREQLVARAFRASVLGYFCFPFHFWAFILIVKAWSDVRPLQADLRRKLRWATYLNGFFMFCWCVLLGLILFHDILENVQRALYQLYRSY